MKTNTETLHRQYAENERHSTPDVISPSNPPTPQVSGNPGNEEAEKVSESEGVKDAMETNLLSRELRARMWTHRLRHLYTGLAVVCTIQGSKAREEVKTCHHKPEASSNWWSFEHEKLVFSKPVSVGVPNTNELNEIFESLCLIMLWKAFFKPYRLFGNIHYDSCFFF